MTSLGALTHRMRCVHRLRKHRLLSSSFQLCMLSLLTGSAESSRGALKHPGFGLSASAPGFHSRRLPSRLTSRSSRRRVVASLKRAGMRAILAPIRRVRRGLTPALALMKQSASISRCKKFRYVLKTPVQALGFENTRSSPMGYLSQPLSNYSRIPRNVPALGQKS